MTFGPTDAGLSLPVAVDAAGDDDGGESGAILVLTALALVVLMGMAGFAVDLGWLHWQRVEATKAAESAALAGVVHMPNLTSSWGVGVPAFDEARDIAGRAGYSHGVNSTVTPAEVAGRAYRLAVNVERVTPTIFMRLFGISTVSIAVTATAEFLPPLKVGSDQPYLGNDPDHSQRDVGYWLAVNGPLTAKKRGDPFSVLCSPACPTIVERVPAYFYAVDVPPSEVGKSLDVQIYDGPSCDRDDGWCLAQETGDSVSTAGTLPGFEMEFNLYAPDQTPLNPSDNTTLVCHRTFGTTTRSQRPVWDSLINCPTTSVAGIYVLSVHIPRFWTTGIGAFSIRAVLGGQVDNDAAVYGMEAMSLWISAHQARPSSFRVVEVDERYTDNDLIVSLFDLGDVDTATANIQITGALRGIECDVRVRDGDGVVTRPWGPDDGTTGCMIDVSGRRYDGEWVDLRLRIPSNYNCNNRCWVDLEYAIQGGERFPAERTTWTAAIEGLPLRIVP